MPRHHEEHARDMGPIYLHTMRTLPTSCHMLPHMQRRHACIAWHVHAGKPATLIICGVPGFTYGHAIHTG